MGWDRGSGVTGVTITAKRTLSSVLICDHQQKVLSTSRGQAVVEFSLTFLLLLVIMWIPADFGLAFFSGQLASNAAREGARIGSASPNFDAGTIQTETCKRLPWALLNDPGTLPGFVSCLPYSNAKAKAELIGGGCNQAVQVTVSGNYNFFFYQLLHLMGITDDLNTQSITRETSMRWEHQC